MMTVNALIGLFGSLAPVYMTLLLLAGVGLLLKSAFSQDAIIRQQRESLKELRDHVTQTVKSQVELNDQVEALRERCARLVAHQQLAKSTSSDHRRFDLAVRMLKRGVGDIATLQELGLSESEAELLWRLHGSQSGDEMLTHSDSVETPANEVEAPDEQAPELSAEADNPASTDDEEIALIKSLDTSVIDTETMSEDIAALSEEVTCSDDDDVLPELTISLDVLPMPEESIGDDVVELSEEVAQTLSDDNEAVEVLMPSTPGASDESEADALMGESVAPQGTSQAHALLESLRSG